MSLQVTFDGPVTVTGTPTGNRVFVIGTHYEAIRTGEKKVTAAELNEVLTAERDAFNPPSDKK